MASLEQTTPPIVMSFSGHDPIAWGAIARLLLRL